MLARGNAAYKRRQAGARDPALETCDAMHKMKTGYLIDMDGVIYRENHLIPAAVEFVEDMLATETAFLFLTNNSEPTGEERFPKTTVIQTRSSAWLNWS